MPLKNEEYTLLQVEKIILSSILLDKECMEYAMQNPIPPEYFKDENIQKFLRAFNEASNIMHEPTEGLLLDRLTLGVPENKKEEAISIWKKRIQEFKDDSYTENREALEIHIGSLRNKEKLKKLSDIANGILAKTRNPNIDLIGNDVAEIENFVENGMFEIQNDKKGSEIKVQNLTEGYYSTFQHTKDSVTSSGVEERVTTGYPEMDKVLSSGFLMGTYSILAGRPGMGKTVCMLNLACEGAKKGVKTLFISIEMSLLQCFQRLLSKISDVSSKKIQEPKELSPKDWDKLEEAGKEIIGYGENLICVEVTSITPNQLERMIKQYKKQFGIQAVYMDYAQIMTTNKGQVPKEASDFAEISDALRRISKGLNVAMIVGSQLSREVEKRPDKKPIMADIRNSGAFEQDAAVIIGLYRDIVYNKETADPNLIEFVFLKNRFGELTTLPFNCDLSRQAIHSLSGSSSAA